MSCNYEFMGKLYTKEQLTKLLQDKGVQNKIKILQNQLSSDVSYSPDEEISDEFFEEEFPMFSNYSNVEEDTTISFSLPYDKLVKYKQGLLTDLKNRAANLKSLISKETDKKSITEKTKLLEQIQNRVNTLEQEIHNEKNSGETTLEKFKFQSAREFERLKELLNPNNSFLDNFENLNEAKRILNFYKALELTKGRIDLNKNPINTHPFFNLDEILDDNGKPILPQELVDLFNNLSKDFKELEKTYDDRQKQLLESIFNANPKVKKLYGELGYDKITEGLDDVNLIDMYIMDIDKNIFSKTNLIPQVALEIIQDFEAESNSKHKKFEEKLNAALPKAEKALARLNKNLLPSGINGNSFDIFYQQTLGRLIPRVVTRYSQKYYDDLSTVMYKFKTAMLDAQGYGNDQLNSDGDEARKKAIRNAYLDKKKWFRENTMMFDVRKLPEIQQMFPEFSVLFEDDGGQHKQELIDEIGEIGYREELEKQVQELKKYIAWRDSTQEMYLEQIGVDSVVDLSNEQIEELKLVIAEQNPFYASENFYTDTNITVGKNIVRHTMNYNVTIPRKNLASVQRTSDNKINIVSTKESSGYYDSNYQIIESDKDLKNFYDIIKTRMDQISDTFPVEVKENLFSNSLPSVRKGIEEIYADPNISFLQKISNVFKSWYEQIKAGFGVNIKDPVTFENLDVVTNRANPKVDSSFLNNNKERIQEKYNIELKKVNNLLKNAGLPLRLNRYTELPTTALPYPLLTELSKKLNIPATYKAFESKFGKTIKPADIIYKLTLADTLEQNSTNLPKVIKYYSIMAAEYEARQQALPLINTLKEHYSQIKSFAKSGSNEIMRDAQGNIQYAGLRNRANTKFESWFNRVVLGNFEPKAFGINKSTLEEKEGIKNRMKAFFKGRILNEEERKLRKDLNDLIRQETDPEEREKLIKQREKLGKELAASAAIDNLLNYIRYLGLGWKLPSMITNFMEGQIANMTIAASGDYFAPGQIYRANTILKHSMMKNASLGYYATPAAKKLRNVIDRFDLLQDSTNELQKASVKTPLNNLDYISPYMGNKRVEYLNQSPLVVAIMLDTEIIGKNGQKGNLWDALNPDGSVKPEFATRENIEAWEQGKGDTYKEFKKKVSNAIVMAHGNYDKLRGLMAKETVAGKALLMFKTWMGSQLYQRLAVEQDSLSVGGGVKGYKGRYLSHTKASASLHGATAGFLFAGPMGALVGGGFSLALASYRGKVKSNSEMKEGVIGSLKEATFLLKGIARKMAGFPINTLFGKEVLQEYPNYNSLKSSNFTERDVKNMKGLINEISLLLAFAGLSMAIKAMLWDDDDEDDDPRRQQHNVLMNYVNQLIGSSTSYLYLPEIYNSLIGTSGLFTFCNQVSKVVTDLEEYVEGNDISTRGANAGESKLLKSVGKVTVPAFMRDDLFGFGTMAERQFTPKFHDDWFFKDEKKAQKVIDQQRSIVRKELEEQGLDSKEIDKILNRYLKKPKAKKEEKEEKQEMTEEQKNRTKKIIEKLKEEKEEREAEEKVEKENQQENK